VLVWQPLASLPEPVELADLNRHAVALLALLGTLDEPPPPLEESPQLAAHLHRLDQKLDLLLNLTGQWLKRELALPAPQPLRLGLRGVVRQATLSGGPGRISVYRHGGVPTAVYWPSSGASIRR